MRSRNWKWFECSEYISLTFWRARDITDDAAFPIISFAFIIHLIRFQPDKIHSSHTWDSSDSSSKPWKTRSLLFSSSKKGPKLTFSLARWRSIAIVEATVTSLACLWGTRTGKQVNVDCRVWQPAKKVLISPETRFAWMHWVELATGRSVVH